jgi:hypothetical protein
VIFADFWRSTAARLAFPAQNPTGDPEVGCPRDGADDRDCPLSCRREIR